MYLLQQTLLTTDKTSKAGTALSKGLEAEGLGVIVNEIIAYAFIIAGALAVVFIFWGGIKFIVSGGDDEKVKQAIGAIRHALIGLVITVLSFAVVSFIGGLFGLDIVSYISAEKIWELISNLSN